MALFGKLLIEFFNQYKKFALFTDRKIITTKKRPGEKIFFFIGRCDKQRDTEKRLPPEKIPKIPITNHNSDKEDESGTKNYGKKEEDKKY